MNIDDIPRVSAGEIFVIPLPERRTIPQAFQQRMTPAQYALTRTDLIFMDPVARCMECGVWIAIFPHTYQPAVSDVLESLAPRYESLPMNDDTLRRFRADAVADVRAAMMADGAE